MNAIIDLLNQVAPSWLFNVFHATWQSTLVALALMLLIALGRRWPAPLRYSLLLLALIKFAMPPLLAIPVGVLSHIDMAQFQRPMPAITSTSTIPQPANPAPAMPPMRSISLNPTDAAKITSPAGAQNPATIQSIALATANAAAAPLAKPSPHLELAGWLLAGHLIGAILLMLWIIHQFLMLIRLSKRATELHEGPVFDLYVTLADQLCFRRRPRLLILDQAIAPVAFGALRPVVLLSRALTENLSPTELRTVLSHELAHHRRRDPLVILLQLIILVSWWFNPVLWALMRQIRKVREDCCDDLLLERALTSSDTYCDTLLRTSRELIRFAPVGAALGFAESMHPLARRLRRIMDLSLRRASRLSILGLLSVVALAAILLPGIRSRAGIFSNDSESSLDLQEPEPEWVADFKPSGVLSGRILGVDGKPVVGANVHLYTKVNGEQVPAGVTTNAKGDYAFPEIYRNGDHVFIIDSLEYVGFPASVAGPIVSLKQGSQMVKHFVLKRACQIDVLVVDESGQPLKKADVYISSTADSDRYSIGESQHPDASGKARLGGLRPSSKPYLITAMDDGYAPEPLLITLQKPGSIEAGQIVMRKGVSVKGHAICSDGKPAAGWSIYLEPKWWHLNRWPAKYPIDKDGNVTLEHVTPGDYTVNVYIPDPGMGFNAMTATLPAKTEPLEIRIPKPSPGSLAAISGSLNWGGAKLRDNIQVMVYTVAGNTESTYLSPGKSDFKIGNLLPGVYSMRIESGEIKRKVIAEVKAPGTGLKIDLEYVGRPHVKGIVLDAATGQPISKFKVRLRKLQSLNGPNYSEDAQWRFVDDAQGQFDFEVLGPGVYKLQVAAEGRTWVWSPEINTDKNAGAPVTIRLPHDGSGSIHGRVVNEQGAPVEGATVLPLSKAGGLEQGSAHLFVSQEGAVKTASDGQFALGQISVGTETLKVIHPDYAFTIVPGLLIEANKAKDAGQITLERGGAIEGHVYDVEGKPAANVNLFFQDREAYGGFDDEKAGKLASAVTDAQGYYHVDQLPEAPCYIRRGDGWGDEGVLRQMVLPANGQKLTADLGGGNRITGRLLHADKPLAGHEIVISGLLAQFGDFRARLMTDATGSFTFMGVPPGHHTLYAAIPGMRDDYVRLKEMDLKPADTTSQGKIDLGDLPLPNCSVSVSLTSDEALPTSVTATLRVEEMKTNDDWGYAVGETHPPTAPGAPIVVNYVAPGHYAAMLQLSQSLMQREYFDVKPGTQELRVIMKVASGNATLQGVSKLDGDQTLQIISKDKRIRSFIKVTNQQYRIEHLPAGEYQIGLPERTAFIPVKTVSLTDGEVTRLDIEGAEWTALLDKFPLVVQTFDANGLALSGAETWLEHEGATTKPEQCLGAKQIFSRKPGQYALHARYPGYRELIQTVKIEPWQRPKDPFEAEATIPTLNVHLERE